MDDAAHGLVSKRILIIQGHPDPCERHFGHALADAYAAGAQSAGHDIKSIELSKLSFPLLRSAREFYQGPVPEHVLKAQNDIRWAAHLLFVFPIWHGHVPALVHAFLEQTFRPGFSIEIRAGAKPKKLLTGKTARIIATMGMPALFRWFSGAHSLTSLKRNILHFSGIRPVRTTVIGGLGFGQTAGPLQHPSGLSMLMSAAQPERQLDKVRMLGIRGC